MDDMADASHEAAAQSLSIVTLVLALSAAVQTVRTWRADLVAGRRRLRLAILSLSLLFIGLLAGSDLTSISCASVGISGSLASALGLLALAALAGWSLFYPPPADLAVDGDGSSMPRRRRSRRIDRCR